MLSSAANTFRRPVLFRARREDFASCRLKKFTYQFVNNFIAPLPAAGLPRPVRFGLIVYVGSRCLSTFCSTNYLEDLMMFHFS